MRSGLLCLLRYAGSAIEKKGRDRVAKVNVKSKLAHAYFREGSNRPARAAGGRKNTIAHNGDGPFAPW